MPVNQALIKLEKLPQIRISDDETVAILRKIKNKSKFKNFLNKLFYRHKLKKLYLYANYCAIFAFESEMKTREDFAKFIESLSVWSLKKIIKKGTNQAIDKYLFLEDQKMNYENDKENYRENESFEYFTFENYLDYWIKQEIRAVFVGNLRKNIKK